jgi:putative transposase
MYGNAVNPTDEQAGFLDRQFGAVRFVFNKALHIKTHQCARRKPVREARPDAPAGGRQEKPQVWLAGRLRPPVPAAGVHQRRPGVQEFLRGARQVPRFKRKRGAQSSYHCGGKTAVGVDWIAIPKLADRIQAVVHRQTPGELKSITLSKTPTGKYFAACRFDDGQEKPEPPKVVPAEAVVGIDVGLTHIAIASNGNKTDNPRFVTRAQRNLRRKQKSLSRKKKGSKNRAKARRPVAGAHERVTNARGDFQHKLCRHLVDENQAIGMETLKIKNMQKSRCLAKAIGDAVAQPEDQDRLQGGAGRQPVRPHGPMGGDVEDVSLLRVQGCGDAARCAGMDMYRVRSYSRPRHQRGLHGETSDYRCVKGGRLARPCLWRPA